MTVDVNAEYKLKDGTTIRIERTKPKDAAEAIEFQKTIADETIFRTSASDEVKSNVNEYADRYRAQSDETGVFLKAVMSGKIVAVGHVERPKKKRSKHNGELGVSVLKKYWSLGIGSLIMDELINWSRQVGITRIHLKVNAENHRAIKLYEHLGFVEEGRLKKEKLIDGKYYDTLIMALHLQ